MADQAYSDLQTALTNLIQANTNLKAQAATDAATIASLQAQLNGGTGSTVPATDAELEALTADITAALAAS